MMELKNCVGGQLVDARGGARLSTTNPATGEPLATLPASQAEDVEAAVLAAEDAFPAWAGLSPAERSAHLMRLADAIEARFDDFAQAESDDNGKPLALARRMDVPRGVANLRFFATAILHTQQDAHAMGSGLAPSAINYTLRQPLGVVGCIAPWNLPLYLFTWKIAPALAAGNCVVAKPTEVTPLHAHLLAECAVASGFPPGVLNIVHGLGAEAGAALVAHPRVKAISFTGGTATGQAIARTAAPQFKKLSLELGGKNPTLVFADATIEAAVDGAVRAAFTNQGEICLCGSRILVEASIYERFREAFVARVRTLKVGDPRDEGTDVGAIVSMDHFHKVMGYLALAREEGGRVLCGGEAQIVPGRCAGGTFIQPTVLEGLGPHCRTNQEEIFGPVATLQPFANEAEALALANATPYGLASSVWTNDLTRAHRVAAALEAGIVWVNSWLLRDLRTPFGGVKQSGVGREGGRYALEFFTEAKNVCIQLG